MQIRDAAVVDAEAMSDVLGELVAAGIRKSRDDVDFVRSYYLDDPDRIRCSVAVDDEGRLLGFQSLKRADVANPYDTPLGWSIIGTQIRPSAARVGIGSRLWAVTLTSAREAGLPAIEAYIAEDNAPALAYYESIGFGTWRRPAGVVCKSLHLSA